MKTFLCIVISLTMCLTCSAQNGLLDWAEGSENQKSLSFTPVMENGRILVKGGMKFSGKQPGDIFAGLLFNTVTLYNSSRGVIKKLEVDSWRCLTETNFKTGDDPLSYTFYPHKTVYQVRGDSLLFTVYDIQVQYVDASLIEIVTLPFEEIMPKLKPRKKKYKTWLKEFVEANNEDISDLYDSIQKYPLSSVKHWDNVENGTVVKGMNTIECVLAWGTPQKMTPTQTENPQKEQWEYEKADLFFEDLHLVRIQYK